MSKENFFIAQIGRTIGLWGDLKLHLHTDFPEQFKVGQSYSTSRGELTIAKIDFKRGIVCFRGYESIDSAKRLTNLKLYATEAQTKEACTLKEGEHFWFDVIGCRVDEGGRDLGVVEDIQRLAETDYLSIKTDSSLVEQGLPKQFLVPYIERYVIETDTQEGVVFVKDAIDILEAS